MNVRKQALLLVGSPRGPKSTSESLGTYILNCLSKKGLQTVKVRINPQLKSPESISTLLSVVDSSDILILSCPLYADGPPALVIRDMELIAGYLKATGKSKRRQFLAISNCGFPEAQHNDTALAVYRQFAKESGLKWAGGLALGMGEAIGGKPLNKAGFIARNVRKSLEIAADALAEGRPIPLEAVRMMAKPLMPVWLYTFLGEMGFKFEAGKNGVSKRIYDRPWI